MSTQWAMILSGWAALFLFVVLVAYKIVRFATLPKNLRWEVYPVPHETGDKRHYGGSYMEEVDWIKKPRAHSLVAEWREMASEIFLLKRVREHNPYGLWSFSLILHWGLYSLLLWLGLLTLGVFVPVLAHLIPVVGSVAFFMGAVGAVGLIVKRASQRSLALYTAPVDYFHLVFLAAIFGSGFISWLVDQDLSQHQAYFASLFSFQPSPLSPLVISLFLLLEAFAVYMPCSKLIHYIAKYFTFHETLWDDAFKVKGSEKDQQTQRQLAYQVSWAGPHIAQGKTWNEQ